MNNKPTFQLSMMSEYPDFSARDFNEREYKSKFQETNVIINTRVREINYQEHCPCLSIKCAFNGFETYRGKNSYYSINDESYLLFNTGTQYSNIVESEVESFSVNFSNAFIEMFAQANQTSIEQWMDDPWTFPNQQIRFTEKLYSHDGKITELILRIRSLCQDWLNNQHEIEEIYYDLMECLIKQEGGIRKEIQDVDVIKQSTKNELYIRLNRAKDYIDSCYTENITLDNMASIACLNQHYFLRQFKKVFNHSPYQYLQNKRMEKAYSLLANSDLSIAEVCNKVGYNDVTSFCKLFKRKSQRSPSDFRKEEVSIRK